MPRWLSLAVVAVVALSSADVRAQWVGGAPSTSVVIGNTAIQGGTANQLLYDNAGLIGEITKQNSSVLITNGSGVPSWATTLPSGLAATNMTLTTPNIGVATATSINGNTFTAGTYTLTGAAGKTFTFNNNLTLSGTDGSTLAIGTGGTLGTAAYVNTGTSAGTVPLLNGNNTFSGTTALNGVTTLGAGLTATGQTITGGTLSSPTISGTVAGAHTYSGALTFSSALTYGGVALSNAVTGTGSMVLSAGPTFTGTPAAPTAAVGTNTTQLATAAFVQSALPPAPNMLVNPSMDLDQVNEGATVNASGAYPADQWQSLTGVPTYTFTAQRSATSPPAGFNSSVLVTITGAGSGPAATEQLIVAQPLEGDYITNTAFSTAGAQSLYFSFQIKSSVTGTYGWFVFNAAGTRSYVGTCVISQSATWTTCGGTVSGDTTAGWTISGTSAQMYAGVTLAAGSSRQTTAGAWQAGNFRTTSAQTQLSLTNGATFNFTAAKLEISSVQTPFVRRPFSEELQLAQRWVKKTFPQGTAPAQSAGVGGAVCGRTASTTAGTFAQYISAVPPMRAAPTVTTYNPSAANANWRDVTGTSDVVVQVDVSTAKGDAGVEIGTQTTALTAAHDLCIHAVLNAQM